MMRPWILHSTKPLIKKATQGHLFIKATVSFLYTLHAYWKGCSTGADGSSFSSPSGVNFRTEFCQMLHFLFTSAEWCGSIARLTKMFRDVSVKRRNPRMQSQATCYTMCLAHVDDLTTVPFSMIYKKKRHFWKHR